MNVDPRLRGIEWRDLLTLSSTEKRRELLLSLPWLLSSLFFYQVEWYWLGAFCSFYFFLTGLRQSHGAQHYVLGISRSWQDIILFVLSVLMLASMHAIQVSHLHHHRHCLDEDDTEGATAHLQWWQALIVGPLFLVRLHCTAWRLASRPKRLWIMAELLCICSIISVAIALPTFGALLWHTLAMLLGESLTGFFAVWTVHRGCEPTGMFARTQRGRWISICSYSMFFHAEHHLFPSVPTCRLAELAARLDKAAPEIKWQQVMLATK